MKRRVMQGVTEAEKNNADQLFRGTTGERWQAQPATLDTKPSF